MRCAFGNRAATPLPSRSRISSRPPTPRRKKNGSRCLLIAIPIRYGIQYLPTSAIRAGHRLFRPSAHGETPRCRRIRTYLPLWPRAERKLLNSTETQREARHKKVAECRDKLREAEQDLEAIRDYRRVELKMWNGQAVEPIPFRWSCKRIVADLALRSTNDDELREHRTGVSRAEQTSVCCRWRKRLKLHCHHRAVPAGPLERSFAVRGVPSLMP